MTLDRTEIRENLKNIQGRDGAFAIITEADTGHFINFGTLDDGQLYLDIPVNNSEPNSFEIGELTDVISGLEEREVSAGRTLNKHCTVDEAADATVAFLEEVCGVTESDGIEIDVHLGEVSCPACGETVEDSETKVTELYLDEARELEVEEDVIQEAIGYAEDEIRGSIGGEELGLDENHSDEEYEEAVRDAAEQGPIFVPLCKNCHNKA